MRVLITGGQGQLGLALTKVFQGEEVYSWGREELDFTNHRETIRKIDDLQPDLIIHSGAMTDVKGCELQLKQAYLVNALGTRNVAVGALECDAKLVYISTDYVFDGKKGAPYLEYDSVNPLNVYGRTKLAGEESVRTLLKKAYIIRTAWLYSADGSNFLKNMLRLAKEGRALRVVDDQYGTPTYVSDVAEAIRIITEEPFYGVYHVSNQGECTWYEFAQEIFRITGLHIEVTPVTSVEYGDIVKRPVYSVLENFNLEKTYGLVLREWQDALGECIKYLLKT